MSNLSDNNIRIYNRNLGTFEHIEESLMDPNETRLTNLLIGGLMGYSFLKGQNGMNSNPQTAYAQAPQQQPQPRIPYPPNFIPTPQQQMPLANLNQAVPYINRYFYFWPTDDHNLGYWIFVTYIDGMGVRGFHFNGQTFTQVTLSPQTLKAFFVY